MSEVRQWLKSLGLERYAEAFEREEVSFDNLAELTDDDLKGLGLPLGPRKTILKAISGSGHAATVAPIPSPNAYTPSHLADKILTSRAALEGERKQVTVLFCDIVDSTALAARIGEEQMHALLSRFFELAMAEVHRYEGTINQFLGDGFMALFGAPVAHEDHTRRAVLAALDIRRAVADAGESFRGLELRMGLNTGPVVVGKIGDNLRMDYTAVGDTTNLAARLQQRADPGVILISEATQPLVEGYIRAEALAALEVKGKSAPVAAFKVLGRGHRVSRLDGRDERTLSHFVGRTREMASMMDILAEAEAGRGQVVGIVGEPGVGKSRLVYELRERLRERGCLYVEGRCLSYGGAIPYLPILDLLRAQCGVVEADTAASTMKRISSALWDAGMDDESLPYLLLLLGVREGTEGLREMSPETVKARTVQALIRLLLEKSRRQPLVVAVEDLHWVDKTSEELLAALAGSITGAAVLLLGTYRLGYRPPWMDQSYATQIALRPLSAEDSRSVVASALAAGPIVEELAQSIVRKAEGNPFFLEELARSVAARGEQTIQQDLPDTIQGLLLARIDRLPEYAKRLLQTAAVLGREAPLRLLRATHDAPDRLDADLQELKHHELLYERADAREPMFVFKHVLTQEAAYDSLLSTRRAVLHEAAGHALERLYADRLEERYDLLAYHYPRSPNTDKAFEYLVRANKKAMSADAPIEAKGYFERAMELLDALPDTEANQRRRLALLADQVVLFQNLFQMQEYYELLTRYEPVAIELNDPTLLGPLVQQIGHCDWTFGRFERAHRRFARAAELLEPAGNYAVAAQTYQIWMWNHLCRGNFRDALTLQDRVEVAWQRQPNLRWYVYALSAAALAYGYLGRFDEGINAGRKAVAVAEKFHDTTQMSFAAWALGFVYVCQGDLGLAMKYGALGVEKAPTPAERAWADGSLAAAWCRAGQIEKTIEVLAPLYAGMRSIGFVPGERWALFLGEAYCRAGRLEDAQRFLEEGLAIHTQHGMRYEAAVSRRLLGEVAASREFDPDAASRAEGYFSESIDALEQLGAEGDLALACEGYARLCVQRGRPGYARELLERALSIVERLGTIGEGERLTAQIEALLAV